MKTTFNFRGTWSFATICILAFFLSHSQNAGAQSKPVKTGYAAVNGLNMYYEIHGKGEPLVLLHGGLGASGMLGDNITTLAKVRKVIVADLQAHGRTADIDREMSLEYMADDIAALLKHLDIAKADIMGYSMGAGAAMQTAIRHPEVVNKLIIASMPFRRNGFYPEILEQQAMVGPDAAEMMKQTPMYQLYDSIAPKKEDWKRLLTKIGQMMRKDFDWTENIKKIKAHTLIIAADADIFPPSHAVELYELLGGGKRDAGWDGSLRSPNQLAILPNATHYNLFMLPSLSTTAVDFLTGPGQKTN
jgi:pimeloyl-ACP methyl ester carboxylesterase